MTARVYSPPGEGNITVAFVVSIQPRASREILTSVQDKFIALGVPLISSRVPDLDTMAWCECATSA